MKCVFGDIRAEAMVQQRKAHQLTLLGRRVANTAKQVADYAARTDGLTLDAMATAGIISIGLRTMT